MTDETTTGPQSVTEANDVADATDNPNVNSNPNSFIINHINEHSVHFATRVSAPDQATAESLLLAAHTDNRIMATYADEGQSEQDGLPVVDLGNEP